MARCKNCNHKILYHAEFDYWLHVKEFAIYEIDLNDNSPVKNFSCCICGCENPEPKESFKKPSY